MAKMFSVCLKTGVAVHVPLVSLSFLRKKQNPTKPQGPKKTVQAFFFSVFVIVKSSDWTRSRRKAGKTWEWRGVSVLDGFFCAFLYRFFGKEIKVSGY